MLVTAVRNLLDNAIAYSPPGSQVGVGLSVEDGFARIAVVDQGIGVPEDKQARLFERFYRVDAARSRETGGTGLGLAIVKRVAADHGGDVQVWSRPGLGSTFTLRIPADTIGGPWNTSDRPEGNVLRDAERKAERKADPKEGA
jgi:two-component system sensor histidine kinase SenX3